MAYDNPKGPAVFRGHIDDIRIEGNPAKQSASRPSDYVNTLRGTHSNGTFSREYLPGRRRSPRLQLLDAGDRCGIDQLAVSVP